jgi:hypothetical protein
MLKKVTALALGVVGLTMVVGAGDAQAISKCTAANLKNAGKLAAKRTSCRQKAVVKNDFTALATCDSDNVAKFDAAWAKAITKGDCRTDTSNTARDAVKALVSTLISDLNADLCDAGDCSTHGAVSKCTAARWKAAGKKAYAKSKCLSKNAAKGLGIDPTCLQKAEDKFSNGVDAAYEKAVSKADCETATPGATVETTIDDFVTALQVSQSALSFTTTAGTPDCGPPGLTSPPAAPTSGGLFSDTACSASITSLGLGCLYFGGGSATTVPPGRIPDGATNVLGLVNSTTLGPSTGNQSSKECTRGDGPGKHCVNNNTLPACANDGACGGTAGSCADDANCYFGPPLPIVGVPASLTTCVLNVIKSDASGTVNLATGASSVSLPLLSRVYITGNSASPCPTCIKNKCDATWKTGGVGNPSPDSGNKCVAVGALATSHDCRPNLPGFQAPLDTDLTPLTTGTASKTNAGGLMCVQSNAGAFGKPTAKCITETGSPAGDSSDGAPHGSRLGSVFCIPATGNPAIDGVADLPGPGAIGLNGTVQVN